MPLEDLTGSDKFPNDLNAAWPLGSDSPSEGDNHLRGIKNVLRNWAQSLGDAPLPPVLDGKAPLVHEHVVADITDWPAEFPPADHTHTIAEVTGLQPALDAKAPLAAPALTGAATLDGQPLATVPAIEAVSQAPSVTVGAGSTLVLSHQNRTVRVTTAGNITVPPNSSAAFPIGARVNIGNWSAGAVTIVAGGGVTLRSAEDALILDAQYKGATLEKIATDEWWIVGNLS